MFAVGLLQWWYGAGIRAQLGRVADSIRGMYDYFSIDLLARSLFAPFRQISATGVRGSFDVQFRAFIDRLVSRAVGTVMRSALIVIGIVGIVGTVLLGVVWIMCWVVLPLAPVVGVILALIGWVPWTI